MQVKWCKYTLNEMSNDQDSKTRSLEILTFKKVKQDR